MFPKSTVARLTAGVSFVLIVAILGALAWTQWLAPAPDRPESAIGGDFTLTNTQGETVSARDLRGRYLLVFFGYTHCPDVCPTTLNAMTRALDVVGESRPEVARRVTPVFITIDPARDDVARMRDYVANFHPRTVGLTGSPEAIAEAAAAYHVAYSKVDPEEMKSSRESEGEAGGHAGHGGGNARASGMSGDRADMDHADMDHGAYLMRHSSYVFLMGPEGRHLSHVNAAAGAPRIAAMIRQHVTP